MAWGSRWERSCLILWRKAATGTQGALIEISDIWFCQGSDPIPLKCPALITTLTHCQSLSQTCLRVIGKINEQALANIIKAKRSDFSIKKKPHTQKPTALTFSWQHESLAVLELFNYWNELKQDTGEGQRSPHSPGSQEAGRACQRLGLPLQTHTLFLRQPGSDR